MENKSHALSAGVFVVAIAALLAALAVWLSRDTAEHRVFELTSRESVTGLQPQAGVRYKGVLVGRVTAIGLDPVATGNVLVRIAVNDSAPITPSTFASLGFQGVTGLAFIALDDSGESKDALPVNPAKPARIPMRPGLFSKLSEQGISLVTQMEAASRRANQLLAEQNQKQLMDAVGNLGQAAASINQWVRKVDQANLPALVQDAGVTLKSMQATAVRLGDSADAARSSADAFKRTSLRMSEPGGTLDKIAKGTDALVLTGQSLSASLVPRLNRTVDDTARAVRQVGRAADAVNENPQSLILGRGAAQPGPGEPGFAAPGAR